MRSRTALFAWVCAVLGAGACTSRSTASAPFTVVDVEPAARVVPLDTPFVVKFSAPVDAATVTSERVVLVPTERVNATFLSDLNSDDGLGADRRAHTISMQRQVSGDTITLIPDIELPASTGLSVLVSDTVRSATGDGLLGPRGEPGHFQADYITVDENPRVDRTSLPIANPGLVPPNLRSFTFTLTGPVSGADASAVRVTGQNGAQDVTVESVAVLLDGRTLKVRLADGTCRPLCPQATYAVDLGAPLTGLQGQPVDPFHLEIRALDTPDDLGPTLAQFVIQPSEDRVLMTFLTREAATGSLRVGPPGGPYASDFTVYSTGDCVGVQAARQCPYAVAATGLDLGGGTGRAYGGMLELVDDFGNLSVFGEFSLNTVLLPRLRITEVYNNPPGDTSDEGTQEFVELINVSTGQVYDLGNMTLATLDPLSGAVLNVMDLEGYAGGTTLLGAGERAVIGGARFDPAAVSVSQDALIMIDASSSRTTLLGGLSASRDTRKPIALFMGIPEDGAPLVTFYRAPEELYQPGNSFPEGITAERLVADSLDDLAVWCHSQVGPTPGRANSVEGLNACP